MPRTQISLDPAQYRRLGDEARRLGISASALVRRLGIDTWLAIDSDLRAFGLHCIPPLD